MMHGPNEKHFGHLVVVNCAGCDRVIQARDIEGRLVGRPFGKCCYYAARVAIRLYGERAVAPRSR